MASNFKKERSSLKKSIFLIALFLFLTFIFFFILGISVLIPELIIDQKNEGTIYLGSFGSYMNIIVAITSTITAGLVFYGVRIQGIEFKETRKSVKDEEKSNRTMKIAEEWFRVRHNLLKNDDFDGLLIFFELVSMIEATKFKKSIRTDSINNLIVEDVIVMDKIIEHCEKIENIFYGILDSDSQDGLRIFFQNEHYYKQGHMNELKTSISEKDIENTIKELNSLMYLHSKSEYFYNKYYTSFKISPLKIF